MHMRFKPVTSGFDFADSLPIPQAKSRGLDPSDCQALSDIADVSTALLRQKEMLSHFQELTYPKLDTWVVARVTDSASHAQSAATTDVAANSAVTSTTLLQPPAEHASSAVTAAADAVATAPDSVQNRTTYVSQTQAEAGMPSQIPQAGDGSKQEAKVQIIEPASTESQCCGHISTTSFQHGMLVVPRYGDPAVLCLAWFHVEKSTPVRQ